jgi:hypothetical protein
MSAGKEDDLPPSLVFLDHYLGRLDNDTYRIAFLKLKLLSAGSCNHTFNNACADSDHNVRHDLTQSHVLYNARQLISSGKSHINVLPRISARDEAHSSVVSKS